MAVGRSVLVIELEGANHGDVSLHLGIRHAVFQNKLHALSAAGGGIRNHADPINCAGAFIQEGRIAAGHFNGFAHIVLRHGEHVVNLGIDHGAAEGGQIHIDLSRPVFGGGGFRLLGAGGKGEQQCKKQQNIKIKASKSNRIKIGSTSKPTEKTAG